MADLTTVGPYRATYHTAIAEVDPGQWDGCGTSANPYVQHRHLAALEDSRSIGDAFGYSPRHVVLWDAKDRAVAAAPTYLKNHSFAELGVDFGMSMAHERAVGPYYPKLQVEVALTPIAGPRLLCATDDGAAKPALIAALKKLADIEGASSIQMSYATPGDQAAAIACGMIGSQSNAYIWRRGKDRSLEDTLDRMRKSGRRRVRRDRRRAAEAGLSVRPMPPEAISPEFVSQFFRHYAAMYERHGTDLWLTEAYFSQIVETMADVLLFSTCFQVQNMVGASLAFAGDNILFNQHWVQKEPVPNSYFETLYTEMEGALAAQVDTMNYGTTGLQKASRGIGIEPTFHAFWFRDPAFTAIASAACARKIEAAAEERAAERARMPFDRPSAPDEA